MSNEYHVQRIMQQHSKTSFVDPLCTTVPTQDTEILLTAGAYYTSKWEEFKIYLSLSKTFQSLFRH